MILRKYTLKNEIKFKCNNDIIFGIPKGNYITRNICPQEWNKITNRDSKQKYWKKMKYKRNNGWLVVAQSNYNTWVSNGRQGIMIAVIGLTNAREHALVAGQNWRATIAPYEYSCTYVGSSGFCLKQPIMGHLKFITWDRIFFLRPK